MRERWGVRRWVKTAPLIGTVVMALGSATYFVQHLADNPDFSSFYVWDVLRVWFWELLLTSGCYSLGRKVLQRVVRDDALPRVERAVVAMGLGVVGFVVVMHVLGPLHLYREEIVPLVPVVFLLLSVRDFRRIAERVLTAPVRVSLSPLGLWIVAFGACSLLLLYLPLLSPASVSTDAAWFHLSAAEEYAREGYMVPFYGDYAKNIPQLTSLLHTYAFLVPGLPEPLRWVLAMHTEFVLFVFTLAGVAGCARFLGGGDGGAWVVMFLYPSIYIYDSNLGGAADHIAAFFCIGHVLLALRFIGKPDRRLALLAGVFSGAQFLTKLQALYVLLPLLALALGYLVRALRNVPERRARGLDLFAYLAMTGAVLAPHFLKNAVFHGNPVYPFMMDVFPSYPSFTDSAQLFREHYPPFDHGPFWPHFIQSVKTTLDFPFTLTSPHGIREPFIGALFTLTLPVIFFWKNQRVWLAAFVAILATFQFVYAFPTPRNLQSFLPLLAAVSAACLYRAWNLHFLGKIAVSVLVLGQVVMGGDLIVAAQEGALSDVQRLARSGTKELKASRYTRYRRETRAVRELVPKDGVLLLHTLYSQLGLARKTVLDWPGFQGLVDYRPAQSPRDIYLILRKMGVTHLAVNPTWPAHSRQEQVLFDAFVERYAAPVGQAGAMKIWKMPIKEPPVEDPYQVALFGLPRQQDGLYSVEALDQLDDGPVLKRSPQIPLTDNHHAAKLLETADAAFVGQKVDLSPQASRSLSRHFKKSASFGTYSFYLRRGPQR